VRRVEGCDCPKLADTMGYRPVRDPSTGACDGLPLSREEIGVPVDLATPSRRVVPRGCRTLPRGGA
jgi:hypothetical protein